MGKKVVVDGRLDGLCGRGVLIGVCGEREDWVLARAETVKAPEDTLLTEEEWAVEHAEQVIDTLPGGVNVVGVYSIVGDDVNGEGVQRDEKLVVLAESVCLSVTEPIVVTGRGQQWKVRHGGNLTSVEYFIQPSLFETSISTFQAVARIRVAAKLNHPLKKSLTSLLEGPVAILHRGRVYQSTDIVEETEERLKLLLPALPDMDPYDFDDELSTIYGDVSLIAIVRKSAKSGEIVKALKEDLSRSLDVRINTLFEVSRSNLDDPPMPSRAAGTIGKIPFLVSDYLLPDESIDYAEARLCSLFDEEVSSARVRLLEFMGPLTSKTKAMGSKTRRRREDIKELKDSDSSSSSSSDDRHIVDEDKIAEKSLKIPKGKHKPRNIHLLNSTPTTNPISPENIAVAVLFAIVSMIIAIYLMSTSPERR